MKPRIINVQKITIDNNTATVRLYKDSERGVCIEVWYHPRWVAKVFNIRVAPDGSLVSDRWEPILGSGRSLFSSHRREKEQTAIKEVFGDLIKEMINDK